jgi:hypothetical protein
LHHNHRHTAREGTANPTGAPEFIQYFCAYIEEDNTMAKRKNTKGQTTIYKKHTHKILKNIVKLESTFISHFSN